MCYRKENSFYHPELKEFKKELEKQFRQNMENWK
jgi:BMFP domain-containing protein YqiC